MLRTFLPVLADEAQQCIALLLPPTTRPGSAGGAGAGQEVMARGKSVRFAAGGR